MIEGLLSGLVAVAGIVTAYAIIPVSEHIVNWTWDALVAFRKFRGTI